MHNILVPVLHIFIEADVPGTQDRPRSWCVYYSSRIYSSSKLRLNSSQCNSTIVRKSVRGICIQSKALQSFGTCTYNQRNNDLRKVNFDTSCIRTTYKGDKGDKEGSTWLHGDNEGDKELQECWDGVDQLQELYFSILFSGGQGHDSRR